MLLMNLEKKKKTMISALADGRIFITILQLSLILLVIIKVVEGNNPLPNGVHQNGTNGSPWLIKKIVDPRAPGCRNRPWICNQGVFPTRTRRLCCRNRCVEVSSDVNNCGLCGIRCPFTWQCCRGLCIDININPFHCGRCENRCPFGSLCFYGMCGYAQPLPPFPFPPRPPHAPNPPHPPHPPHPWPQPPHPPRPWPQPPHPPHPWPQPPHPPHPWPQPPHPPHGPHPWPPRGDEPPPLMA